MPTTKKTDKTKINNSTKAMPNSVELEVEVLGAMLTESFVAKELCMVLSEDDFYFPTHKYIFKFMKAQVTNSKNCDLIAFYNDLTEDNKKLVGGLPYLTKIVDSTISSAMYQENAMRLQKMSQLRKIIILTDDIMTRAYNNENARELIEKTQQEVLKISDPSDTQGLKKAADIAVDVDNSILDIMNKGERPKGLKVGFTYFDNVTNGGLLPGQMIVVAARPGCGKTSYVMNLVANIARETPEKVVAVFNLEMAGDELIKRMLSTFSSVPSQLISNPEKMDKQTYNKLYDAKKILANANVYIDDTAGSTMEDIHFKVSRLMGQLGRIDLVVIDHMQLIDYKGDAKGRYEKMTEISRAVKMMAKSLQVPVIVLSQMSRSIEQQDDGSAGAQGKKYKREPMMSDLRESGAIEQDADMICFLMEGEFDLPKDNDSNGDPDSFVPLVVKFAKNRSGDTPKLYYGWHKDLMQFIEIEKVYYSKAKEEENELVDNISDEPKTQFVPSSSSVNDDLDSFNPDDFIPPDIASFDVAPEDIDTSF